MTYRSPSAERILIIKQLRNNVACIIVSSTAITRRAARVRLGEVAAGALRLVMPGGELSVTVDPQWALTLRGPVEEVGTITLSASWLAAR